MGIFCITLKVNLMQQLGSNINSLNSHPVYFYITEQKVFSSDVIIPSWKYIVGGHKWWSPVWSWHEQLRERRSGGHGVLLQPPLIGSKREEVYNLDNTPPVPDKSSCNLLAVLLLVVLLTAESYRVQLPVIKAGDNVHHRDFRRTADRLMHARVPSIWQQCSS